ncbi:MAG TPA: putative baseplate assembly protein [Blastocatellia bacterium]|nr:putative baseplate assembly protein [Blastocatellia bacterium]
MSKELPIPIDYTNLGYDAMREAMLDLARRSLPEWTDLSESDLGVLLLELFAYACDVTLYYQTRIAANLMPETADEPQALVQLLRLIGYELRPPAPASANLCLAFDAAEPLPINLPAGAQFFATIPSGQQLTFETERAFQITNTQLTPPDAKNFRYVLFPVPVVEGHTEANTPLGKSDGSPNQMFTLPSKPVIERSIQVIVTEPGNIDTYWQEVTTLADSSPADRHFVVQRDAEGAAAILFGDGVNGMIPPPGTPASAVSVRATYRVGGGQQGNLPARTSFRAGLANIREAINAQAAAGGTDGEDIERARLFAPRLYRTQERAVSAQDYVDLALTVPGVGKARAVAVSWSQVVLYIAPSGRVAEPSELLKRDLLAFFESRRMVTTQLTVVGPQPADIYLGAVIRAQPYYRQSAVRAAVEQAVADYLAFDAVSFGQPIYLSKVYDVIQSLPEVASLTVFKFSTTPALPPDIQAHPDVDADGIIELGPSDLPRPGYRDNPNTPINPLDPSYRPPIFTIIEGGIAS